MELKKLKNYFLLFCLFAIMSEDETRLLLHQEQTAEAYKLVCNDVICWMLALSVSIPVGIWFLLVVNLQ